MHLAAFMLLHAAHTHASHSTLMPFTAPQRVYTHSIDMLPESSVVPPNFFAWSRCPVRAPRDPARYTSCMPRLPSRCAGLRGSARTPCTPTPPAHALLLGAGRAPQRIHADRHQGALQRDGGAARVGRGPRALPPAHLRTAGPCIRDKHAKKTSSACSVSEHGPDETDEAHACLSLSQEKHPLENPCHLLSRALAARERVRTGTN